MFNIFTCGAVQNWQRTALTTAVFLLVFLPALATAESGIMSRSLFIRVDSKVRCPISGGHYLSGIPSRLVSARRRNVCAHDCLKINECAVP